MLTPNSASVFVRLPDTVSSARLAEIHSMPMGSHVSFHYCNRKHRGRGLSYGTITQTQDAPQCREYPVTKHVWRASRQSGDATEASRAVDIASREALIASMLVRGESSSSLSRHRPLYCRLPYLPSDYWGLREWPQ